MENYFDDVFRQYTELTCSVSEHPETIRDLLTIALLLKISDELDDIKTLLKRSSTEEGLPF